MGREDRTTWKANYFNRIASLFDEYSKCLIVGVDNVGSKQMQQIRYAVRGHAEILMGKNTMIRKAIRGKIQEIPALEKILPYIAGNVGFVFTKKDLGEISKKLRENRRGAPAKIGAIAPCDVKLPPQNTGMSPEKTSFFQAIQIPTKISRGTIEILNEVFLIKAGTKVGASEAALLNMLNIQPFMYGLVIQRVYDNGAVYSSDILDITNEDLQKRFKQGVANIAALSLEIGYPTKASIPHSIINAFNNLLAIAAETEVTFEEAKSLKEYLANPTKFATVTEVAPTSAPTTAAAEPAKNEQPEESDDDLGLGLFD